MCTIVFDSGYRTEAFVWDATNGMRSLHSILTNDFNFNLFGWNLSSANAISYDGSTIVGDGVDPEGKVRGWVVNLGPSTPTLRITRVSDAVVLSWPVAFSNLTLRSGTDLPATNSWSTVTDPRFVRLDEWVVTNSLS